MVKKVQVPVIGGLRKIIQNGSDATVGTTIAELGSATVSLAQLAQLLANLEPPDTGLIGDGTEAVLVPGKGLGGGGPMLGAVNLYLTAPIPIGDSDTIEGEQGHPGSPGRAGVAGAAGFTIPGMDGDEGEPGSPGAKGAAGAQGIAGASGTNGWTIPGEDGADGEPGASIVGAAGVAGAAGAAGARGFTIPGEDGADGETGPPGPQGLFALAASPTAVVGLTAIPGVAGTFMRSDAAPAIDLTMVPVWTGEHTFQAPGATPVLVGGIGYTGGVTLAIQNTSTVSGDTSRVQLQAGTEAFGIFVANQNQAGALITNGPTGPQGMMRTLGAIPIVFGTNNTYRGQIDATGQWTLAAIAAGLTPLNITNTSGNFAIGINDTGTDASQIALGTTNGSGFITVTGTATVFNLSVGGVLSLSVSTAGAFTVQKTFAINAGTPTAKPTGYGTPVGTPVASITNASTLANVAQTLAALLIYLKTIGFIGA